jgi:benzoate/toluate 1,2-dioxygenase reductase component
MSGSEGAAWSAPIAGRTWWSKKGFALELSRPDGFRFLAGQTIRITHSSQGRDYSIASAPDAPRLQLCLRLVEPGLVSSWLAAAPSGTMVSFSGPSGMFLFRGSPRPAVMAATGTGIAPFLSMVRAGLSGFTLLHGVREREELYGGEIFRSAAVRYVPCLSAGAAGHGEFAGRVTAWIQHRLPAGSYDFYLCGRRDMVRDVTRIVDDRFPDSRVYTEIFY